MASVYVTQDIMRKLAANAFTADASVTATAYATTGVSYTTGQQVTNGGVYYIALTNIAAPAGTSITDSTKWRQNYLATFIMASMTAPYQKAVTITDGHRLKAEQTLLRECPAVHTENGEYVLPAHGLDCHTAIHIAVVGRLPVYDQSAADVVAFPWVTVASQYADAIVNTLAPVFVVKGYPLGTVDVTYRVDKDSKGDKMSLTTVRVGWRIPAFYESTWQAQVVYP